MPLHHQNKNKNKMKSLFLILISVTMTVFANAQSNKEDIDLVQAIYGKEKKTLVAEFISITDETKKAAFWKLYDEYELKRKAFGQKRIELLEKYANAYSTLDDKTTDALIKENIALQKNVDGLIVTYYEKIKSAAGSKPAASFFQLEGYLLSATRMTILDNIPFIGELEKKRSAE
jgi:membrane-associated HD superfamily phosphohydrolase